LRSCASWPPSAAGAETLVPRRRAAGLEVLLQSRSEGMLNSALTAKSLRPGCAQA
jgi:hypothetical protein